MQLYLKIYRMGTIAWKKYAKNGTNCNAFHELPLTGFYLYVQ